MPRMYKVPGQWTTDPDVLPSPAALAKLASVSGGDVVRNREILGVAISEAGADPEETLKAFGLPAIPWTESDPTPDGPDQPDMPMDGTDPGVTNGS